MNDSFSADFDFTLQDLVGGPDLELNFYEEMSELFNPENAGILTEYSYRPVDFITDELGIDLTPQQVEIVNAVWKYSRVVVKSATGTGKTFIGAVIAVTVFKVFEHSAVLTVAAPPSRNLGKIWKEIGKVMRLRPDLFATDIKNVQSITRSSGGQAIKEQKIDALVVPKHGTRDDRVAKFSGEHQDVQVFINDEGDAIPDEAYEGEDGCQSGGTLQSIVIFFNPKKRQGEVYRMIAENDAHVITLSALDHPNVVSGENLYPGAVTREQTVKRINEWTRPITEGEQDKIDDKGEIPEGYFELPEYLVGATAQAGNGTFYAPLSAGIRKVDDPQFSYKVLGEYPAEGERQLFAADDIDAARARWDAYVAMNGEVPPEGATAVAGFDVADDGSDFSSLCYRYGGFVARLERKHGLEIADVTSWAVAQVQERGDVRGVRVDAIGVGAAVPGMMTKALGAEISVSKVKVSEKAITKSEHGEFFQKRDELYWLMSQWLKNDRGAMLPPTEGDRLRRSLLVVSWSLDKGTDRVKVSSKQEMRRALGYSPDEMESLLMTFAPQTVNFFTM